MGAAAVEVGRQDEKATPARPRVTRFALYPGAWRAVLLDDAWQGAAAYSVGKTVTAARAKIPAMVGPGTSGTFSTGIGQLRSVMRRYISPILVDSVLTRALETHPVVGRGAGALHAVTADCMIGLRLFVKEQDLPVLMLELAEILEAHDGR